MLAIGLSYVHYIGWFFLRGVDPEYAYLFNGLLLGQFHPDLQYTDHPGTPVQFLIAVVSWVVHLFRPGQSYVNDILLNPELYIRAALYTADMVTFAALFALGVTIYRNTSNLSMALFLQLTPFTHALIPSLMGRLMPELIMCSIVCCWMIALIKLIYSDKNEEIFNRYSIVFGILFGLSLADKMTFLPYFLLPLMVLKSWKQRLKYSAVSLLSFILFAIPAVLNYKPFIRWIWDLVTHSGPYGQGERAVIDWELFTVHLKMQIDSTRYMLFSAMALLGITLFYIFRRRSHSFPIRVVFGILAIVPLQYLITSKHFAFYYMAPAILLTIFMISISFILVEEMFPGFKKSKGTVIIMGLTGAFFLISEMPKVVRELTFLKENTAERMEVYERISSLFSTAPKIICPNYYYCSAKEYAINFGLHYSGRNRKYFAEKIKKLYPSAYLYYPWEKKFYDVNDTVNPSSFIHSSDTFKIVITDYTPKRLNEILLRIKTDTLDYNYNVKEVYILV